MKSIFFYPQRPVYNHIIYKVIEGSNELNIVDDIKKADVLFFWSGETIVANHLDKMVFNGTFTNMSKRFVSKAYELAFHRKLMVNPTQYHGWMVEKSDENATHDGKIIRGPIKKEDIDPLCVYQKAIDSRDDSGECITEYRVPIIGQVLPLVYKKIRPTKNMFSSINLGVDIFKPDEVFSDDEIGNIVSFSKLIGMDIGEIDVIRSKDDGNIYIVDANRTPNGPPNGLSLELYQVAINLIKQSFINLLNSNYQYKQSTDLQYIDDYYENVNNIGYNTSSAVIEFLPTKISDKFFAYRLLEKFISVDSKNLLAYWYWSGNALFSPTKRQLRQIGENKRYIINEGSCNLLFDRVQKNFYSLILNDQQNWEDSYEHWRWVKNDSFGSKVMDIQNNQLTPDGYVKSPYIKHKLFQEYQVFMVSQSISACVLREYENDGIKSVTLIGEEQIHNYIPKKLLDALNLDILSLIIQVDVLTKKVFLKSYSATFMWPPSKFDGGLVEQIEKKIYKDFSVLVLPKLYYHMGVYFNV